MSTTSASTWPELRQVQPRQRSATAVPSQLVRDNLISLISLAFLAVTIGYLFVR